MTSVSTTSTTTKISGFNKPLSVSATRTSEASKPPARKAFSRSPYRSKTVMLRVPEPMLDEFRKRLDQYKQAVAAGEHDNWD